MSTASAEKTALEKDPVSSIIACCVLALVIPYELAYAFFWVTGSWLPLWVDAIVYVMSFLSSLGGVASSKKARTQPIYVLIFLTWFVLWLAHFAAAIQWPLLHA